MTDTGKVVFERTYARTKPDGSKETWEETVERVVDGNLALVPPSKVIPGERELLLEYITSMKLLPAGRHLWASGVPGATHLMNCWASGWTDRPSDHFEFTFMRLMEGGGVGANYSNIPDYEPIRNYLNVHVVCSEEHQDYQALLDAGVLSTEYSSEWHGSFEVEDSREGWASAVVDLLDTFWRDDVQHQARVYDVSNVRPAGARLKTFGGTASGPLPLAVALQSISTAMNDSERLTGMTAMLIDHYLAECVVSGGVRRSARMAMMKWDDPEIFEFLRCKESGIDHWTTNISVEVDSDFWLAVEDTGDTRPGFFGYGDRSQVSHAQLVLTEIVYGMYRNGEPGFWDSSLSSVGEPGKVEVTNPCGEITLEAWEPCNLGHVNLAAFVNPDGTADYDGMFNAHKLMARFLVRATFSPVSDPKSREILDRNRRIGVGHLGVASFLAMTGVRYSEATESEDTKWLLIELRDRVESAATQYAHDLRIPVPVKMTTVAPTGTIAKLAGVSEGIHPIFASYFIRRIRFSKVDEDQAAQVEEYRRKGYRVVDDIYAANTSVVEIPTKDILVQQVEDLGIAPEIVESVDQISLKDLLAFQQMYQRFYADNAVSYTANFDRDTTIPPDILAAVKSVAGGVKGATVFPEASMELSPYERITPEEFERLTLQYAPEVADGVDEECSTGACPVR